MNKFSVTMIIASLVGLISLTAIIERELFTIEVNLEEWEKEI